MFTFAEWKASRQRCRSDLLNLCHILGYTDVNVAVHGRLLQNLQKFPGGEDTFDAQEKNGNLVLPPNKLIIEGYKPHVPNFWDLTGPRQRLNMIPRGHLKTTVATVAHAIQWIINYPNVRILLFTHSDGKAKDFLGMIKNHFIQNEMFRFLFPEHCPMGKQINTFGNQEHFDTLARTKWIDKESTVQFLTIDSAKAGGHFDVIKADDVVDDTNVITKERVEGVKKAFSALEPLLDKRESADGGQKGWFDLTGTFYDFSDLNYATYETEKAKPKAERAWSLNVQSAAKNWPEGPYLWPERFGYKILKQIEQDPTAGPGVLAAQYLMNPIPPNSGLVDSPDEIVFIARSELNKLYAYLSLHVTVDLAGMEGNTGADNDYTVINLSGFGKDGKVYVLELLRGRYRPDEVIGHLFSLWKAHPRIQDFKIEKDAHARVLGHFLRREMDRRNVWLPIIELKRDNRTSKQQRIRGLQAWLKNQTLKFASDLACKQGVIDEIMRFPKFAHDDILDTIADQMQNRDGGVEADAVGRERIQTGPNLGASPAYKFVGFDDFDKQRQVWLTNNLSFTPDAPGDHDPMTGW